MKGNEDVVLEERIRSLPMKGRRSCDLYERVRRSRHEPEEERGHHEAYKKRPGDERICCSAPEPSSYDGDVAGQHERPQEDRPLQRGPHAGDRVEHGCDAGVVVRDICKREVMGEERMLHRRGRDHCTAEHAPSRPRGGREPSGAMREDAHRDDKDTAYCRHEAQGHADLPENRVHELLAGEARTRPG